MHHRTLSESLNGVGAFVPRNWKEQRSWAQAVQKPVEQKRGLLKNYFQIMFHMNEVKPVIFSVNPDAEGSKDFVEENAILLGNNEQPNAVVVTPDFEVEAEPLINEQPISLEADFENNNDSKELLIMDQEALAVQSAPAPKVLKENEPAVKGSSQSSSRFVISDDEAYENGDTFF